MFHGPLHIVVFLFCRYWKKAAKHKHLLFIHFLAQCVCVYLWFQARIQAVVDNQKNSFHASLLFFDLSKVEKLHFSNCFCLDSCFLFYFLFSLHFLLCQILKPCLPCCPNPALCFSLSFPLLHNVISAGLSFTLCSLHYVSNSSRISQCKGNRCFFLCW